MFGTGASYNYFRCSECGTLQILHPEEDELKLYPKNYYSLAHNIASMGLKKRIKRFLFRIKIAYEIGHPTFIGFLLARMRPSMEGRALRGVIQFDHSILDVGCGTGYLIEALAQNGYKNLIGIEPHIEETIIGNGFKVLKGRVEELNKLNSFDVIMMHHSFEHMSNPDKVLESVSELLTPEGVLILRIPVCDSEAFEIYLENWGQLDAPRHVYLYSTKSVQLLAERHGFRVERSVDDSGIFQFVASEQYRRGIPLVDKRSYYRPIARKLLSPSFISRSELQEFSQMARLTKMAGHGDQRTFYLKKIKF